MATTYGLERLEHQIGGLLERHEARRNIDEFRKYAEDPVGFIRHELRNEPWEAQEMIARATVTASRVVVRSAHAMGKDWLMARVAIWAAYARGALVLCTGPSERQVKNIIFGEIRRAFAGAEALPGELYELELRIDRRKHAGIIGFTSNDVSRFTGFHAPEVWVIVTEAQGMEGTALDALAACTTGDNDRTLMVGNPILNMGRFYQASRSPAWKSFKLSAFDCPNVQQGKTVIPGAVTQSWVDWVAREHGVGSPYYISRVLAEFPEESEEALILRSWLEASAERWQKRPRNRSAQHFFALDPARLGADKSALGVRIGRRLEELVTWEKLNTMATCGRLQEHVGRYGVTVERINGNAAEANGASAHLVPAWMRRNGGRPVPARCLVDVIGLGGGIVDRLRESEIGWEVHEFNAAAAAVGRDAERFLNMRAQAYWMLRRGLEENEIDLPFDESLWEELAATNWQITSGGRIQIASKDEIKAELGRSPDRADAVSMAFWADLLPRMRWVDPSAFKPWHH